jgi:molybdopterin-synthase adenylyltransferase
VILSPNHIERYSRHILLPEIGARGQKKLLDATVAIIGMGGLGCAAAQYLAASGVGRVIIIDGDVVDASNLQRQILYAFTDIGTHKVLAAQAALQRINQDCTVLPFPHFLGQDNHTILKDADVIIDGTDTFTSRALLNRLAIQHQKPLVAAAATGMHWQGASFLPHLGGEYPCYECVYPALAELPLQNCATSGVLAPTVGLAGVWQAQEVVRVLLSFPQIGKTLTSGDALTGRIQQVAIQRDASCILHQSPYI